MCRESQPEPLAQPSESKPRTLLDLSKELENIDDFIETLLSKISPTSGDNISPELQLVADNLLSQREETYEQYIQKLDNYAALIQSRKHWAESRKAEGERMLKLAETDLRTVEILSERLRLHLETQELKKVRTRRFNLTVATNGGKQPIGLNVEHPKDLPERFRKVTYEPDKTAIREALSENDPEAMQIAYLRERGTHLRIK